MSIPQSKCAHELKRADGGKNLFGAQHTQASESGVGSRWGPPTPHFRILALCQASTNPFHTSRTLRLKCTTMVANNSFPHNCGMCHATAPVSGAGGGAPRCTQKALPKSLYCDMHAAVGEHA